MKLNRRKLDLLSEAVYKYSMVSESFEMKNCFTQLEEMLPFREFETYINTNIAFIGALTYLEITTTDKTKMKQCRKLASVFKTDTKEIDRQCKKSIEKLTEFVNSLKLV